MPLRTSTVARAATIGRRLESSSGLKLRLASLFGGQLRTWSDLTSNQQPIMGLFYAKLAETEDALERSELK
jgi:hypothetical protein